MIKKLIVAVFVTVVASLSVSGCITVNPSGTSSSSSPTPTADATIYQTTPTPKPVSDYSSLIGESFGGGLYVIERPFTKSINYRGDDVYTGVVRRTDRSQGQGFTCVVELVKTKDEAKRLFDQVVAKKQSDGFTYRSDWVAQYKSEEGTMKPNEDWAGSSGYQQVNVFYQYQPVVGSWTVTTQTA
ncbi:MAG: hypothetical protein ACXV7G_10425 [Halobacteriota archaeon]